MSHENKDHSNVEFPYVKEIFSTTNFQKRCVYVVVAKLLVPVVPSLNQIFAKKLGFSRLTIN